MQPAIDAALLLLPKEAKHRMDVISLPSKEKHSSASKEFPIIPETAGGGNGHRAMVGRLVSYHLQPFFYKASYRQSHSLALHYSTDCMRSAA
jgi:hypothetical protein